jgi:hypothetical protein
MTAHSLRRLKMSRQRGIKLSDVVKAAASINSVIPYPTRFNNFRSKKGVCFSIVLCDKKDGRRIIITIVGQNSKSTTPT